VIVVNGLQHVHPGIEVNPTKVAMTTRRLDTDATQIAGGGAPAGNALTSAQD